MDILGSVPMGKTPLEFTSNNIFSDSKISVPSKKSAFKKGEHVSHPITLSLFSGAGGLDIGFHKAGFKIVACVEIEKAFSQTLELNKGRYVDADCQILNSDIRDISPENITSYDIDFIIGGPPCQSFSAIGRRAGGVEGTLNERGGLFEHYYRLVDYYRPKGFLFENVRGILSSDKGQDWKLIVEAFTSLGYELSYRILDTAAYGVPQHRERVIMVGTKFGIPNFKFPKPTHGPDSSTHKNYVSALEAIADIQEPNESPHEYNGKYGSLLEEVPPGNNYLYFTKEMNHPQPSFAWRSRFSDFLYKADPHKPVRTIVAQLGAYSGPFHWLNRKFTLQEFKRLQTFPDDYNFAGGLNSALKQIGNSVPPIFAEQLAKAVLQQIFGIELGLEFIEINDKLSFDTRKGIKAASTKHIRNELDKNIKNDIQFQASLFDDLETPKEKLTVSQATSSEHLFHYHSSRYREVITKPLNTDVGTVYKIHNIREGDKCTIHVSRYNDGAFSEMPLLKYLVKFRQPVGNGLKVIEGILLSEFDKDIPVIWDAIEDYISNNSNYQTMMDVFGHFTEPHPMFDLDMEILTNKKTFLLRFAKKFSYFEATSKVLPGKILQEVYADGAEKHFNLTEIAQELRQFRFDVRVHETNLTIPPGYFRCCYPFTLNINKQVSVTWKERFVGDLMENNEYAEWLSKASHEALVLIDNPNALQVYKTQPALLHQLKAMVEGKEVLLNKTVEEGIETLVGNLRQSKYLFSMLITGLVEKLVHPNQDIRYTQAQIYTDGNKGFSNRNTDQYHVTPFLKRHDMTSCAASGAESGRNFERPEPHLLNYGGKPRGKGSKEAYLGILYAVQVENVEPFPCMVLLMTLDQMTRRRIVFDYPKPEGLPIQDIVDAVIKHYKKAEGNGKARLPVLALEAAYLCLVPELSRFKDTALRNPPNRHTGNDKDGWIGDVQVDRLDGTPFEGVEVKAGKRITSDMIRSLPEKFQGYKVDRYYILSTNEEYIAKKELEEVKEIVKDVRQKTGCEIIVNGLNRSLWYYLRMLENTDVFLQYYTQQVQTDADTKTEHRELWATILNELTHSENE